MSKSTRRDPLGIRLTTYAELEKIVHGFARGDLKLLILLGSHGLGKSQVLRQAMADQACWLEGNASAFGLYCQLWRHQNRPVVLDDLDGLYANHDGIRLLKSLTQTELRKTVSWYTDAATLQREQIPQEFHTSSRLAIITNEWKTFNRNVAALQDRGHVVIFEPTPQEVHTRTAAVAQLKASPKYVSEAERVQAFVASGAGSRATYFQLCKKLRGTLSKGPSIRLQCQAPPRATADHEMLRILRQWRGNLGNN
ncbi:MAG TPA: hypothetical protein VG099_17170 [Gemmataceae bacterium]|nr:hypothetical protein [Gemmataceae bacterium]